MSTAQRLDPNIRADRAWRSHTVRRLYNAAALLFNQRKINEGAALQLLASWADRTRRDSRIKGTAKQSQFIERIPKGDLKW